MEKGEVGIDTERLNLIAEVLNTTAPTLLGNPESENIAEVEHEDIDLIAKIIGNDRCLLKILSMLKDLPPEDLSDIAKIAADKRELMKFRSTKGTA
ncbi:hypothetical protein FACS1894216_22020 [Synergistales bacterium]|nr:hypothetical protein FACS1894216_22020 [Synergistales bacterium]